MPFGLQRLKSLRLAGTVILVVSLGAVAALYWMFVVEQRQYLVSRNFRLLNTTASQTEDSIRAVGGIFERLLKEAGAARGNDIGAAPSGAGDPGWLKDLKADVPMLRQFDGIKLRRKLPRAREVKSTYKWVWNAEERLLLSLAWTDEESRTGQMDLPLKLGPILEPIFAPKISQRVFDTLAIATADGRVLFATGRRQQELMSSSLAALVRRPSGKTPPVEFGQLARTSAIDEVEIAGARYFLFLQPCCSSLAWTDRPQSGSSTNAGMIIVGLADAGALGTSSYAISTLWIKLAIGAVLLALVGWPFLKLWLIGERQRVRVVDVVQLAASSIFGVALLTIFMLDGFASWRTNRDVDVQLEMLAAALKENATTEVRAASDQLDCLEKLARGATGDAVKRGDILAQDWFKCPEPSTGFSGAPPYPFFESFSLIDADGHQRVKWATNSHVLSKVRVADREYFRRAQDRRMWEAPELCPRGCFVESLWSWTSGRPQAVLSKPSKDRQVAALSIPMRSLMRTTLAPGFEFAVIDERGAVLFHSDAQRNTYENLFQETDYNRRLRASVAAHNAEPLNVRYWGSPYRAFVLPFDEGTGWSVVTLFDQQRLGTLGLEWLAVTLVFLALYMVVGGAVMCIGLGSSASWVWPDGRRRRQYIAVSAVVVAATAVFVLAMRNYHGGALLAWAYAIPIATWLLVYLLLQLAPTPTAASPMPDPLVEYSVAAALLLIVTAVFPAIAFFLTSYEIHAQSYVKQTQVRIAEKLEGRLLTLQDEYSEDRGKGKGTFALQATNDTSDIDTYYRFFYNTTVGSTKTPPTPLLKDAPGENWLLSLFEEYLPYYAESSVEWRQLLHHRAHDRSWFSIPTEDDQTLVMPRHERVVRSTLPALFGPASMRHDAESHARQEESDVAQVSLHTSAAPVDTSADDETDGDDKGHASFAPYVLPLLPVAVVALTCGIVAFIRRHVFLAGLFEPLWARLRLSANAGDNLFVVCDADVKATQIQGTSPLKLGPIAAHADVEAEWRTALLGLDRREPSRAVVIDDFDEDIQNAQIMNRKLTLLEELVADRERIVVVLSQLSAAALANSLSSAPAAGTGPSPRERWKRLLTAFSRIDWRGLGKSAPVIAEVSAKNPWSNRRRLAAALNEEAESDPFVRRVCLDIVESPSFDEQFVTRDQILDEIAERSAGFYRDIWESCSDDEKVVLAHIAQDGLANACSRRTVRRLLGRRLLRKDPCLRVMSRTFRWFLLSPACRAEVVRLEGVSDPGMWNRLRVPLSVGVAVTAIFLFVTQKELFDATVTVATTMTVALPALLRTVGLMAGRHVPGRDEASAA